MTPLNRPWIPRLLAIAAMVVVGACNIFNPSGTGDEKDTTADDFVQSGQEALRELRFRDAYNAFSTALSLDSNKSLAWHGLAKATLGKDSFDIASLVDIADTIGKLDDNQKLDFLLSLGDTGITRIYRPLMRVASIYDRFRVRDSLGRTDKVFGTRLILTELTTLVNNRSYFLLIDANRDTVVQRGEMAGLKMMSIASGGLEISPEKLVEQGGLDSATGALPDSTRDNINGILNNVTTITQDTNILNQLLAGASGEAGSSSGGSQATEELNKEAKSFIQKLGSSTSFFLINDTLDNDGDGCVNEEMFGDSLDNDGDGLKDEDGRIGIRKVYTPTPGALAMLTPPDSFRHDAMRSTAVEMRVIRLSQARPVEFAQYFDESKTLTYDDATGRTQLFKDLRWVSRSDSSADARNDTIWTRVLAEEGTTPQAFESLAESKQSEIKILATIEIRKKVLAEADIPRRIALGKKTVGGCWDHAQ